MASHEHARAIYEDAAEASDRQSLDSFTAGLRRRAEEVREGQRDAVRGKMADALSRVQPEEQEEVADQLEETAGTLDAVFRASAPTMQKLDGDAAAEALQASREMHVDPLKLARGEHPLVDQVMAENIRRHEQEHHQQSGQADAETVTLDRKQWLAEDVFEIAAVSVQEDITFLSTRYREYAAVALNERERRLVREEIGRAHV